MQSCKVISSSSSFYFLFFYCHLKSFYNQHCSITAMATIASKPARATLSKILKFNLPLKVRLAVKHDFILWCMMYDRPLLLTLPSLFSFTLLLYLSDNLNLKAKKKKKFKFENFPTSFFFFFCYLATLY